MKTYVDVDHGLIAKKLKKKWVITSLKSSLERLLTKERLIMSASAISKLFLGP